ncbi:hypothetical protein ALI144C_19880 [Actinosynnema sp. ALI-1.44]|uniref:NlpC/P60 family protein n=1 Tax=Actinosynnema sp. ALI-1.44 TaxID=1933779 RepID=UPI00097C64D7|nr:NlpC/P60 family protein [Actinosynnema sp. ALI-1.44]ONI81706.1 hypothetical protein ALI144C_19880 [Actinosynnema sp. ALI-1.44]
MHLRRFTRLFAASALVLALPALPATAQPTTQADAVERYRELNVEAEQVHQDFLQATEDKVAKQAELDKATADLAAAQRAEAAAKDSQARFRGQVDDLSSARFRGARFDKMMALLTGKSERDFLDRATALGVLAEQSNQTLRDMADAVAATEKAQSQASQAQHTATTARDAAVKLTNEIAARQAALDTKIAKVKADLDKLTAAQKAELAGPPDPVPPTPPPARTTQPKPPAPTKAPAPPPSTGAPADAAARAVAAALSRRGDAYVWGGTKPGGFDCSGLTLWSYAQAGISLPRTSRAQFGAGISVPKDQLRPGDLLFYGSSAGSIHHVAMYVGGGNIVHASTYGVPVKSGPMSIGGRDYFGARRIVG